MLNIGFRPLFFTSESLWIVNERLHTLEGLNAKFGSCIYTVNGSRSAMPNQWHVVIEREEVQLLRMLQQVDRRS